MTHLAKTRSLKNLAPFGQSMTAVSTRYRKRRVLLFVLSYLSCTGCICVVLVPTGYLRLRVVLCRS